MSLDNERARRISVRISEYHSLLADVYENLVDEDFQKVDRDVKFLIMELRCILKSIEENDF